MWSRVTNLGMLVMLAAFVAVLAAPGDPVGSDPGNPWSSLLWSGLLGNLVYLLPLVVMIRHARRHPAERSWTVPLTVAMCLNLAGNLVYALQSSFGNYTFPSLADALYLCVYPALLTGLLLALREHLRAIRLIVALDGLSGALAGAAVTSWATAPLVNRVVGDGSLAGVTLLAFPLCAVVLVAASLGALATAGRGKGWSFALWTLGLVVFGVGDIIYSYREAYGTYVPGAVLDALWPIGLVMLAYGATRAGSVRVRSVPGARSLLVVAVAACSTVVVLAAAPNWSTNPLPSLLSLMALTVCAVRLVTAFLQLRELAAIRELALTDELTGAANRRALHAALDAALETRLADDQGSDFTLAIVDLDHFKEVNDSFGHAAGDNLLRAVVDRFASALAQLEVPHLLARLGGDEFAVLLHDVGTRQAAEICGAALQESLAEPVPINGVAIHVQASVGLALAPEHGRSRADVLFAADAAMYSAKTSAGPVCVYASVEPGGRRRPLEVAEDLFSALERGELTVEYQPIRTGDGALFGVEALVRWDHPTRGRLSPDEFLEVAERYRLTPCIAKRVLEVALADLSRWRVAGLVSRLSVNVSASDLRDDGLVDIVAAALLTYNVPPSALTIEITETAMMRDPRTARSVMEGLHQLGVELSVDDYGTGYSSLEYLLKLPINEIKLDRAFSADLVDEVRSVAIVRSTVDLTHALGLRMVAEGVENQCTLDILSDLGCDLVQGWHTGVPMSATALERSLAAGAVVSQLAR